MFTDNNCESYANIKQLNEHSQAAFQFCHRIIQSTKDYAAAFKPNIAFFEAIGEEGFILLRQVLQLIPLDIPIILDAKRGDISNTANAYAHSLINNFKADAVTIHPYMGSDSILPFLAPDIIQEGYIPGVFVLCKTSNPSADELQMMQITTSAGSTPLFLAVAGKAKEWDTLAAAKLTDAGFTLSKNNSNVAQGESISDQSNHTVQSGNHTIQSGRFIGLVAGATDPLSLRAIRQVSKYSWILIPGIGAQGGELEASIQAAAAPQGNECIQHMNVASPDSPGNITLPSKVLIAVSRGISRAENPGLAAKQYRDRINEVRTLIAHGLPRSLSNTQRETDESEHFEGTLQFQTNSSEFLFLDAAIACGALQFGEFTLKSGRISPYFFNAASFCSSAKCLAQVAQAYAQVIQESSFAGKFDVLFGPAYKGIFLASTIVTALTQNVQQQDHTATNSETATFSYDTIQVAFNRKEIKDHGEGGDIIGADVGGKRIVIVDDVMSAGTAITETIQLLKKYDAEVVGIVIGLDRQEMGNMTMDSRQSAVQTISQFYNIPIKTVAKLDDLLEFVASRGLSKELLERLHKYREQYGCQ